MPSALNSPLRRRLNSWSIAFDETATPTQPQRQDSREDGDSGRKAGAGRRLPESMPPLNTAAPREEAFAGSFAASSRGRASTTLGSCGPTTLFPNTGSCGVPSTSFSPRNASCNFINNCPTLAAQLQTAANRGLNASIGNIYVLASGQWIAGIIADLTCFDQGFLHLINASVFSCAFPPSAPPLTPTCQCSTETWIRCSDIQAISFPPDSLRRAVCTG